MRKIAFLFPGQGRTPSGPPPSSEPVESLFRLAEERGLPLREWFSQPEEERPASTRFAQPAIFIDSIAREVKIRERGIIPACVAGHSLGEYPALVSAGVISAHDAMSIVIERGRLMDGIEGGMMAIVGLDLEGVRTLCEEIGEGVTIANHNGLTQVVVAGTEDGLAKLAKLAAEAGGRGIPLRVSGPFHSPAMRPAEAGLAPIIERTEFSHPSVPFVSGVSGEIELRAEGLKGLMKKQITSCVRWVDVVNRLTEMGVTHAIEVGSGEVLTRLGRRITDGIEFLTYEEASDGGV